jgi:hypothetical protein
VKKTRLCKTRSLSPFRNKAKDCKRMSEHRAEKREPVFGESDAQTIERFRAKWNRVRVKKTRQNKNLESFTVSAKR